MRIFSRASALALVAALTGVTPARADQGYPFDSWHQDRPGMQRRLLPGDIPPPLRGAARELPEPGSTDFAGTNLNSHPAVVQVAGAVPQAPPGFAVTRFATGLVDPRQIKVAPNGDIFVAESGAGRIVLIRPGASGPLVPHVFASGLRHPFGIAFYPPGPDPLWVYVGDADRIVRMRYRSGDISATSPPQTIVPDLPVIHHSTRDLTVAGDGRSLFYSIGSGSNEAGDMPAIPPGGVAGFAAGHALGEAWGSETGRAQVRQFDPDGHHVRAFGTGLRNCVAMALQPGTGTLWCAVGERNGLGDNTPPDYATSVRDGAFYGWPWYYIGDNPDPRLTNSSASGRADLLGKVTVPDVLLQAHTAPQGIAFYDGAQFPAEYSGDAFVTMHGAWDRAVRTGYKVVRLRMTGGRPSGVAEDFLTGFVVDDHSVRGRPGGVAVAHDGSLLVSDDASGSIWRVSWVGTNRPVQ